MSWKSEIERKVVPIIKDRGVIDDFRARADVRLSRAVRIHPPMNPVRERILELTGAGMVPEVVAGHFNHMDPVVASEFCKYLIDNASANGLGENLNGFVATLASSVPGGQQSLLMKELYSTAEEYVGKRGVEFFTVTREADRQRFAMDKSIGEQRSLVNKLKDGKAVGALMMAGGSVQSGRQLKGGEKGQINGLQDIGDIDHIVKMFRTLEVYGKKWGQEPYVLPIGIDNSYLLFSSDTLLPTPEGIAVFYDMPKLMRVALGVRGMVVDIKAGMPLVADDFKDQLGSNWRKDPRGVNTVVMEAIAHLLPFHARGVYAHVESLEVPNSTQSLQKTRQLERTFGMSAMDVAVFG